MSPRLRRYVLYGGLLGAVLLSGSFAYGALSPAGTKTATSSRTVTVQTGSVSQTVSVDGSLAPAADVTLNFGTSGTITEIDVAAGDAVTAGQVLAKLDPAKAQTALDIANLNLTGAQTKLSQAQAGTASGGATGGGGSSSSSSPTGASQATIDADQVAVDDAQKAAAINANGYQLAVDQAQHEQASAQQQLAADQQACTADATSAACGRIADDQDQVRKAGDDVANAQQAQAAGQQRDQQAIHEAQAKLDADQASQRNAQAASTTPTTQAATVDASAIATAKSNLLSAQDQVTAAQKALDSTTLVAPTVGTITAINLAVGDSVTGSSSTSSSTSSSSSSSTGNAGGGGGAASGANASSASTSSTTTSFGTLIDTSGYSVAVSVPETDATKVKVGQQATITVDALDSQTPLTGSVTKVADSATTTNNVVSYATVVSITSPPAGMKPGMSATVSIAVQTRDDVLEVTTAAITTRQGTSYVNKLVDGKLVETEVTTGLQGDSTTELTSGVAAGDQLEIQTASVAATTGSGSTGSGTLTGGTGTVGGGGFPGAGGGFGGGAGGNRTNRTTSR